MSSTSTHRHDGALARMTGAVARHPWRTVTVWVLAVIAIAMASAAYRGTLVNDFTIPNSDAQHATDLLKARFPQQAGDSANVVFSASSGLRAAPQKATVERALRAAARVPGVTSVGDPYAKRAGAISRNGSVAYAQVQFNRTAYAVPKHDADQLQRDVRAAVGSSGVQAEFDGAVIDASRTPQTGTSELLGLLAAVVVLLIVFGTFTAMLIPIGLALVSLGISLSILLLAAAVWNFNTITPTLATMIGLGVGIDYALFIVTRFRQRLHDGEEPEAAAAGAAATAGRAVIFAGSAVAISILGLAFIGLDFVTKLGLGAAISVVVTVLTATTLLPAVLRLLGHRIDRLRVPFTRQRDDSIAAREHSLVARWGRFVTRHSRVTIAAALLALLIPASAVATVQLGSSDDGSNPSNTTTRKAYDLLARGFGPGFNGPLVVAVDQRADHSASALLAKAIRRQDGVASVSRPLVNRAGDAAVITVVPSTSPQSARTSDLVSHLRHDTVPRTFAGTGARAFVGGSTAAFDDIASQIWSRLPLFLLFVLGVTFLVLAMAFRSVVIALKASLTTILSALASFGILVLVFQHGWLKGIVGLDRTGPIESFLPVIVFAILFGLSMDYEVFLVSRIREEYVHGAGARAAVTNGVAAIGRVIVAAATIMAVVFFAFLLGGERTIKEFGLALGVAIVIDAFIVRLTLVPALMYALGERAWYMPAWLDRILPRLTIEPPVAGGSEDDRDQRPRPRIGAPQPADVEG